MKRFCAVVVVAGLALLSGVVALSGSNPAGAGQFPGTNGKIAYAKRISSCFCLNIWVMNADGSGDTQLTFPGAGNISNNFPSWSPDGTRIAFVSDRDGNAEVYVMNADGSGQTRLTNSPESDGRPSWSPDGTRIAFESDRDGSPEVYVMNADGSGQTNITNNPSFDGSPSWSPDGTRIAFASDRDGNYEVYVMNAAGTGQTRLTTSIGYYPSWSPDGTRIAFASNRDGNSEVFVMNADGTGQTRVTTTAGGSSFALAWQSVPVAPLLAVAPTIQRNATAGNRSATVNWNAPSPNGSLAITGYVVTPYSGYYTLAPQTFTSTATTQTVTGLMNGTTYRFKVAARNAFGTGPMSSISNPVTPAATAPGAPTIGAAVAGHGEATVSWTAPVSDGGSPITGYVVTPYSGYYALAPQTFTSTATTQTVTGLMNGTTYRFRVRAINAVGTGGYSKVTNSVTPTP